MDIKSKNIRYSRSTKVTAAIVVWLCVMGALGNMFFLLYNGECINDKSYYETDKFKAELSGLVHNVVELNVKLKDEASIKVSGQPQIIIERDLERLQRIKYNLLNTVNFIYIIKNTQTGDIVTNLTSGDAEAFIKERINSIYVNQRDPGLYNYLQDDINRMLSGTSYEVYAAVMDPLSPGDDFYNDFHSFSSAKAIFPYSVAFLIASIIIMIASFVYLVYVTGRSEEGGEIRLSFVDRIYNDVHTLLVFIAAAISIASVDGIAHGNFIESVIMVSIVLTIDVFIGLSYVLSMVRQVKSRQLLKNTLTFKIYFALKIFLKLAFSGKLFKAWTLLLLLGYGAVNAILFAISVNGGGAGFLVFMFVLVPFNAAVVYFGAKSLVSLTKIMEAAKEISAGNLEYHLDSSKISVSFSGFAENIESIQGGLKKAVAEAVKGERMKTDLITNVSHDLKTPLTSIINYVDLLKKEELNNKQAEEYVCILEEKSARLKKLIEDLVEASKASSGNLTIKGEKIDLFELVMQACGEYEEKIEIAGLDFRINSDEKKILVFADGKHMWRIIENLLTNILKYSMKYSRVYVDINKRDMYGVLTIKNISAFPLNISPEQLTERFVRGDVSRTTEGSGLGLSIAQSLTNLQGGKFYIDIDGDLFKVVVEIPLWQEKQN